MRPRIFAGLTDLFPVSVAWRFLLNLRPCRLAMVAVSQATSSMLVVGSDGHRDIGIRLPGSRICKVWDIVDHVRLPVGCGQHRCLHLPTGWHRIQP